jgi:hypothetical protein
MKNPMSDLALILLLIVAQVPRADSTSQRSVEVKRWKFPYENRTLDISYSRASDGKGSLDIWMDGGGPGPGSRAQLPYIKSVLDDMKSAGIDPHSLRHIGSSIYLDDLIPLAIACVHSSDCRRTMETDRQKGGLQLSIRMLNEEKILAAYQDILTPYGLTFKVCDADNLFVKHFKDYGLKSEVDERYANSLVPANLVVTLCVEPKTH